MFSSLCPDGSLLVRWISLDPVQSRLRIGGPRDHAGFSAMLDALKVAQTVLK
jgi:hypothetical protein